MNKAKANISKFDICSLIQQHKILHEAFKPHDTQKGTTIVTGSLIPESDA
jgi:hypothetical protein